MLIRAYTHIRWVLLKDQDHAISSAQNFINSAKILVSDLTLSWQGPLSCRNQSIDLQSTSMDWFLYDNGHRHERVKRALKSFKSYILKGFNDKSAITLIC